MSRLSQRDDPATRAEPAQRQMDEDLPGSASLLTPTGTPEPDWLDRPPPYLHDLNLDQWVASLVLGEDGEKLRPMLHTVARDASAIRHRQDVFRDLDENEDLLAAMRAFRADMADVRRRLGAAADRRDERRRRGWQLDAALHYCGAVTALHDSLEAHPLHAAGLRDLRRAVGGYRTGPEFSALQHDATATRAALDEVRYDLRVRELTVEVSRDGGQGDYSQEITETFRRFQQGQVKDYRVGRRAEPVLGHVGSAILDRLERLFGEEFARLAEFSARHADFLAEPMLRLEHELGFFLSYRGYIEPIRAAGLPFCYPTVDDTGTDLSATDTFDIVLADKLVEAGSAVVPNDLRLAGRERALVVTGPNQGGKSTFARAFGQLHHLAAIGLPVPGSSAQVGLFDTIHTHFQTEEHASDLRGKLEDDLIRMRDILTTATERSVIVLNETFSSTTIEDAGLLGAAILRKLLDLGARTVYVTFVDELASLDPGVVSMVSQVVPDDPAQRTFRIVRAPSDGLAYALAIAEKHGVTYRRLREVLGR